MTMMTAPHETENSVHGAQARTLALRCTSDLEIVAEAMVCLADQLDDERGRVVSSLMRCYGIRIKQLNSAVMEYLNNDTAALNDLNRVFYGGVRELPLEKP